MRTTSAAVVTALALSASLASAAPSLSNNKQGTSIPLRRRVPRARTTAEIRAQARRQADALIAKYVKKPEDRKRAKTGSVPLTDLNVDFQYYGSISVGTPAKSYDVILDTGSSDLWLASSDCQIGCSSVTNAYDSSASSSFTTQNQPIDIQYGSGEVAGVIGNDTVSMQGFTVKAQGFGVMDQLSANVLQSTLSGLMGLAWPALAQSGATPFWQAAINAGDWQDPLFGFYLARYIDDANAQTTETNGGSMDLGFANTDHYSGNINYIDLAGENYWLIPLQGITVGKNKLNPGGNAAIDTGTSLIGGPTSAMSQIYAQIPNAEAGTGDLDGYYVFPCSDSPSVSLTFGGQSYTIEAEDFARPADESGEQCFGSFFPLDINDVVSWIVGDSFLKNVYSVYRASPASVGFAAVKNSTSGNGGGNGGTQSVILPTGGTTTKGSGGSTPTSSQTSGAAARGMSVSVGSLGGVMGVAAAMLGAVFGGALVL